MDRREALKKIGIGGAAAVGGSMIVSTPAFAGPNPAVLTGPSVTIGRGTITWAIYAATQVQITAGTASCASAGAATVVSMSATPTRVVCQDDPDIGACVFWLDVFKNSVYGNVIAPDPDLFAESDEVTSPSGTVVFDVLKANSVGPPAASSFVVDDEFSVSISTVFRCTYPDLTTTETTDTVDLNFRCTGGGGVFSTWEQV